MFGLNSAFAGALPLEGSEVAAKWDSLYLFLISLSVFFFVLVVGAMIFFAIRYRKREGVKTEYITGNHVLEIIWIAVPTLLLLAIFGWGFWVYQQMIAAPSNAYEVRVIGKQWLWQFLYDNGKTTIGEMYVPAHRPVKVVMTSDDVIHSFFVPNFRVKQDVVPGMYTSVWFEAQVPGRHQVYCTEYCGTSHSQMLAQVIALEEPEWNAWLAGKDVGGVGSAGAQGSAQVSLPDRGKAVFEAKGCVACHSVDGTPKVGPTLKGIYGHAVELADGTKVTVDDNYIRQSIEKPNAQIVKGFQPVMPAFQGMLKEEELTSVISYIKSLQ